MKLLVTTNVMWLMMVMVMVMMMVMITMRMMMTIMVFNDDNNNGIYSPSHFKVVQTHWPQAQTLE